MNNVKNHTELSDSAMNYLRDWTKNFINGKYIPKHKKGNENNLWFANCCTGSGKANLGFECVIQDILFAEMMGKKSVHILVAPTIMLSEQIEREECHYMEKHYPSIFKDVEFKLLNCQSDDKIDFNGGVYFTEGSKHLIEVYCADSFFGNKSNPNKYVQVYNHLEKMRDSGVMIGCAVFDESHNYSNQWDLITGYNVEGADNIEKSPEDKVISKLFMDVVCMSGTPEYRQCWMSNDPRWATEYKVSVTYGYAIDKGWIMPFDIYKIGATKEQIIDATIAAIENERIINSIGSKSNQQTHSLVNCQDINTAYDLGRNLWNYYGCNKDKVGVTVLHSKTIRVENNEKKIFKPFIDGNEIDVTTAKDIIIDIDENDVGKTRVVCQVGMLSEGLNVNSFDAVIITSFSEVKIIQQIGRSVRNFDGKKHVSVYALCENEEDIHSLADALMSQGIEDVLSKVKKIDIPPSGVRELDPNDVAEFVESGWSIYTPVEIKKIMDSMDNTERQKQINNLISKNDFGLSYLYNLIKKSGAFSNGKNFPKPSDKTFPSKTGNPNPTHATVPTPTTTTSPTSNGKKKQSMSSREMVGAMKRIIKSRLINQKSWNDCIITNLDKDSVIHYSLANICQESQKNIDKPDAHVSDILRHMIVLSNNEVNSLNENN